MSLVRPHREGPGGAADAPVVVVRPMRRRDIRAVQRIEHRVYPKGWSAPVFRSELAAGGRIYLVATVDGTLVGYGGCFMAVDEAHITTVAVQPEQQGARLGTRLMVELMRAIRAESTRAVTLEVRVGNTPAIALYRTFGFAPVGVRQRYYENTDDALIMWVHDVDAPEYAARLAGIDAALPTPTDRRVR
jgi:[ribosomal protein S18]-alanine N-acetyltransferase